MYVCMSQHAESDYYHREIRAYAETLKTVDIIRRYHGLTLSNQGNGI